MLKTTKRKIGLVTGIVLLLTLSSVICVYAISRSDSNARSSTKLHDLSNTTEQINMSGLLPSYSFTELVEDSTLMIKGRVSDISDAFKIRWVNGGTSHAMDVTVEVIDTYRGDAPDTVTVRVNGGFIDDVYEDYTEEPELLLKETYLLFLYQPNVGGGKNTEGDYYYITGLSRGVFQRLDNTAASKNKDLQKGVTDETYFVNSSFSLRDEVDISLYHLVNSMELVQQTNFPENVILSGQSLPEMMAAANKVFPVNSNWLEDELRGNYQGNLERGFITQEEYDRYIAEMEEYATIVDDDYKEPVDPEAEKEKERLRAVVEQEE